MFSRMRDNYMVVEVWTKVPGVGNISDKLMGLVKIPLNVFHQSLKDDDIARYVSSISRASLLLSVINDRCITWLHNSMLLFAQLHTQRYLQL